MAEPEPNRERSAVPRRVELDAQQVVNPSGSVSSVTPRLTLSPIDLTLGAGFGVIALNNNPSPMAFVSPSWGYRYSGERADLFANGAIAMVGETSTTSGMLFTSLGAGGTYEIGREAKGISVRAGADISTLSTLNLDDPAVGVGVGVANDNFSVHAIVRGVIGPATVYRQNLWELYPNYHQTRVGASLALSRTAEAQVEGIHAPGEFGGRAALSFSGSVPVTVQATYTERNPVFGTQHEFLAAVTFQTDNPRSIPARMTAEGTTGRGPTTNYSVVPKGDDTDLRNRVASSESLESLAATYSGASLEEKVRAASALAYLAMMQVDRSQLSASTLTRYPGEGQSSREAYSAVRGRLTGTSAGSAGACSEISGLISEFLRMMGVEAYSVSMPLQKVGHTLSIAVDRSSGTAYSVDFDRIVRVPRTDIQSALSAYGRDRGEIIVSATVYGRNNNFVRHFVTNEGRLVQSAMTGRGTQEDQLRDSLTRRRRAVR